MAAELEIGDVRVEFIADYVLKTLRIKGDKWTKMYVIEDNKQLCLDFFDKAESHTLVLAINAAGGITVTTDWPAQFKNKAVYFVKKVREPIPKEVPVKNYILYGDVSNSPIDQLSAFIDEVLSPLLSNDRNHEGWPEVVAHDVLRHVQNIKSRVYVVSGQVRGKTLLPLPVGADRPESLQDDSAADDKALVHAVESVVIEWTHQIREVLKKDSAQPLLEGLNPVPYVEMEFWKIKAQNLECIYDQLCDQKVRALSELLERSNSSYYSYFRSIFQDVVAALSEAQDINLHLKPLRSHFEEIEQADFEDMRSHLEPMMHVVCLIWANSKYYCTPARIIILLQEICNLIILLCRSYLEPTEVFKGEVEETVVKVKMVVTNLSALKDIYEKYRKKLAEFFKHGEPKEWEFAPVLVFHRYDKFLERIQLIYDMFLNAVEFLKLEKVEYAGIKGKMLSSQTVAIFEEFNEMYKTFQEITYDPLDPQDTAFLDDYEKFNNTVKDLDLRLSSIIIQAFDDCAGLEGMFKLIDILSSLLERQIVKKDFEPNYEVVMRLLDAELNNVKRLYDEQMAVYIETGTMPIHKNMAPVSGSLKWSQELRERITIPMNEFRRLEHPCVESQEAKDIENRYQKMLELLGFFEKKIYQRWVAGVDEACSFNLAQPLIVRNEETNFLAVNFDPQLVAVLREVKYLLIRNMEEIPASASQLYANNDTLLMYVAHLDLTVAWYNKIR